MYRVIGILFRFKFLVHGLRNLIVIVSNGKLKPYLRIENELIASVSKYNKHKVLLISGGSSLLDMWSEVLNYDYIVLNSYNTLKLLDKKQCDEIKDKIILYYQAPYHKPIDLDDYNINIRNLNQWLNDDCIKIHNYGGENKYQVEGNSYSFRSRGYLDQFGFKLINSTGVLFVLNLLNYSGFKNVDILGFDANWIKDINSNNYNKESHCFLSILVHNYETIYEIKRLKKKWDKANYSNLNKNSWYNFV